MAIAAYPTKVIEGRCCVHDDVRHRASCARQLEEESTVCINNAFPNNAPLI